VAAGAGVVAVAGTVLDAGPGPAAPLAATLALVVATPAAPAARPRSVLAGYLLSTLGGLLASAVAGLVTSPDSWWGVALTIALGAGLSVALMARFDALHPPAAAAGCVVALHPVLHWQVALLVLAGGALVAGAAAVHGQRSRTGLRRPVSRRGLR
jgi:CBS domain-containing membrane protein